MSISVSNRRTDSSDPSRDTKHVRGSLHCKPHGMHPRTGQSTAQTMVNRAQRQFVLTEGKQRCQQANLTELLQAFGKVSNPTHQWAAGDVKIVRASVKTSAHANSAHNLYHRSRGSEVTRQSVDFHQIIHQLQQRNENKFRSSQESTVSVPSESFSNRGNSNCDD